MIHTGEGIILTIDPLGRILIPKTLRDTYKLYPKSPLLLQPIGNGRIRIIAPTDKSPPT